MCTYTHTYTHAYNVSLKTWIQHLGALTSKSGRAC